LIDYSLIYKDIKSQYLEDEMPWIIGFSGGKDSTTVLQMIFYIISNSVFNNNNKFINL
jgi:DNA sulfur modification protein DndC